MPSNSNKSSQKLIVGFAATLWLIIVLVGYYYTHKPFNVAFLTGAVLAIWRIIVAISIISLSGGIGTHLLAKQNNFSLLTNATLQAALGLGTLGLSVLLMGMTIGFRWFYFAILLLGTSILLWKQILTWLRQWGHLKLFFKNDKFLIVLALGCSLILIWTLVFALAPPLHFDALTYHLALLHSFLLVLL